MRDLQSEGGDDAGAESRDFQNMGRFPTDTVEGIADRVECKTEKDSGGDQKGQSWRGHRGAALSPHPGDQGEYPV
ncbi:hypothetical protein [Nonomuraea longicatena]|uniref:hypothetical protein n=1 Tax=Nonomuraea longicatena TaxID=83682 RepID=UPI0031D89842